MFLEENSEMFKKDTLIKHIREYLSILQSYVSLANRQKLFDINRLSEDFFAGLINKSGK
jgi:hypothetical protein